MKLADKQIYPYTCEITVFGQRVKLNEQGLTFRERLIIALASTDTSSIVGKTQEEAQSLVAKYIISQADAIITELEKEKQND